MRDELANKENLSEDHIKRIKLKISEAMQAHMQKLMRLRREKMIEAQKVEERKKNTPWIKIKTSPRLEKLNEIVVKEEKEVAKISIQTNQEVLDEPIIEEIKKMAQTKKLEK